MKIYRLSRVYLLILSLFSCSSCHRLSPEEKLTGTWKLYHADLDSTSLDTAFAAQAVKSLESSYFYFQNDKAFQIVDVSNSGGNYEGTWEYADSKRQLILSYPGLYIEPEVYSVQKMTRKSLVVRLDIKSVGFFIYKLKKVQQHK